MQYLVLLCSILLNNDVYYMTFTVSVPDDTISAERVNHDIICEEVRGAILDCMILDDYQVDDVKVCLREIK